MLTFSFLHGKSKTLRKSFFAFSHQPIRIRRLNIFNRIYEHRKNNTRQLKAKGNATVSFDHCILYHIKDSCRKIKSLNEEFSSPENSSKQCRNETDITTGSEKRLAMAIKLHNQHLIYFLPFLFFLPFFIFLFFLDLAAAATAAAAAIAEEAFPWIISKS